MSKSNLMHILIFFFSVFCTAQNNPVSDVLIRTIGEDNAEIFLFVLNSDMAGADSYSIHKENNKIIVEGNSKVALCRGAYDYLKNYCGSLISWSGSNVNIPSTLPDVNINIQSPYQYRYYFNVVTHGYTTAYWDWQRWEKEIDWMALHGINMPLIGGAHEAILDRVFEKIGLTKEERENYFTGPAFFPWNRMGNVNGWDGPFPDSYFPKQIELTHKMLNRMKELGITPIVHDFAGFVPKGIKRIFPDIEIRELRWGGGLPEEFNAFILSPKSEYFTLIGKLYIEEWEKEFGKCEYFLADSFNEMDVPISNDSLKALDELAEYGNAVYSSINKADSSATWVMQGWTFPFHRDNTGNLFWTPERLAALVSKVPDDKLLILDLANEYNKVFWKIDPSWEMYSGFFGKKWIYSFIPNMGGKIPLNGILDIYSSISIDALNYNKKGNLIGFGFAPEGIENNEIIYELLSDMGWQSTPIDLNSWIEDFCIQRYGIFNDKLKNAFELLTKSCYGTFTDHPLFRYQLNPLSRGGGCENPASVHSSENFAAAVKCFLENSSLLKNNELFKYDAIDLVAQFLGLVIDKKLSDFLCENDKYLTDEFYNAMSLLTELDRLLISHPNRNLQSWIDFARSWGDNDREKNYYESNAKRIITTWGGIPVNDYAAKVWSGLIRDYYVPRWLNSYKNKFTKEELSDFEEKWIQTRGVSKIIPFDDPVDIAVKLFEKYKNEL